MKSSAQAYAEFQVLVEYGNALQLPYVVATEEEISNAWVMNIHHHSSTDVSINHPSTHYYLLIVYNRLLRRSGL
jgi:hypothetical protein